MNSEWIQLIVAIIFLLLADFSLEFLLIRKIKNKKLSLRWRVALRYIFFFCFIFFAAKIWVEGFGYLVTVIGFISAALTITQKEYLMNFFGWLIIMWRDLFVEGDYIEIGKYMGFVQNIGLFYFSIEEASELSWGSKSGRIIKIPNSMIAANPILNLTIDKEFVEGKILVTFVFQSTIEKIQLLALDIEKEIEKCLHSLYSRSAHQPTRYKPTWVLRIHQEAHLSGIQLRIRYFSSKLDQKIVEDIAFEMVMEVVNREPDVELSVGF